MKSWDIVGYAFNADIYCPDDMLTSYLAGKVGNPEEFTAYLLERGGYRGVEGALDILARWRGIDSQDERSFDSGDFPKVIFAGSAHDTCSPSEGYDVGQCGDSCSVCHEPLGESCPNVPEHVYTPGHEPHTLYGCEACERIPCNHEPGEGAAWCVSDDCPDQFLDITGTD